MDRYGVLIPAEMPPGSYTVEVGLYDFNGMRLPIDTGGDALAIESIEVQ